MIMALIDFEVASESRADLLVAVQPLLAEARSLEGNRSYRAMTDSESPTHIGMVHEWDTLEHFRAYAASDIVNRIGKVLRPSMTTPPVSRRLRTESIEEVRG
jgi:quinol monooxygenase YgiN